MYRYPFLVLTKRVEYSADGKTIFFIRRWLAQQVETSSLVRVRCRPGFFELHGQADAVKKAHDQIMTAMVDPLDIQFILKREKDFY